MRLSLLLVLALVLCCGCQQGPYQAAARPPAGAPSATYAAQLQEVNRRASRLDSNNQDLHAQLAQSQRQVKLLNDEVVLLKERLGDTARKLKEEQIAKKDVETKFRGMQASTQRPGIATIRPNNSLQESLRVADIAGLEVRQEADVIRVLIPSDKIFRPLTVEYQPGAEALAGQIGAAISRNYPRNRVVVEAHVDRGVASAGVGAHQLTASQSLATLDLLVKQGRLPERQLAAMAHGYNQPRASNGTEAGRQTNRRVELVVYPEDFD